jgi:O-antigen ligase
MNADGANVAGIRLTDSPLADPRVGLPPLLCLLPIAAAALLLGGISMLGPVITAAAAASLLLLAATINVRAQLMVLIAALPLYRMGMGSAIGYGFGFFDIYTVWFILLFLWRIALVDLFRFRIPGVIMLGVVMLCGLIPSSITAGDPVAFWRGVLQILLGFLLTAGVYSRLIGIANERRITWILRLFAGSAAVFAVWGLFLSYRSRSLLRVAGIAGRHFNFLFGDPNYYAGFLLMALCIAVGLALAAGTRRQRVILWAISVTLLSGILLTLSRAGYLATILCGLMYLAFLWRYADIKRLIAAAGLLTAGLTAVMLLTTNLGSDFVNVVLVSDRMTSAVQGSDASVNQRKLILLVGWRMAWSSPLVGVGFGNFEKTYDRYREAQLATVNAEACHNTYLKLFAEAGLIGFFLAILYYFTLMRTLWKSFRVQSDPRRRFIMFGLFTGILSYFIMSVTLDQVYEVHFWIMSGVAIACAHTLAVPAERP